MGEELVQSFEAFVGFSIAPDWAPDSVSLAISQAILEVDVGLLEERRRLTIAVSSELDQPVELLIVRRELVLMAKSERLDEVLDQLLLLLILNDLRQWSL